MADQAPHPPPLELVVDPIGVDAGTRLHVTYSLHRSAKPKTHLWVVLHHGICHTREQFQPLIQALNDLGIHVAVIDQQSENARWRNWINIGQYRQGMAKAIRQIQNKHKDFQLGCYALHSMGALIGEAMQRWEPAELSAPTVLMAPVPAFLGAFPITLWLFFTRRGEYLRAVARGNIVSLADEDHEVRELFFAGNTGDDAVAAVTGRLKHAPVFAYAQLILPFLVLPWWLLHRRTPRLLLTSPQDGIFGLWEYWGTRRRYAQLTEKQISGGHDFFIENAVVTAEEIARFFAPEVLEIEGIVRIDLAEAQSVGAPLGDIAAEEAARQKHSSATSN